MQSRGSSLGAEDYTLLAGVVLLGQVSTNVLA
jgi:hypothetical protein